MFQLSKILLGGLALALLSAAAPAAQAKTLTVYTYESFVSDWGPGPKIKEAFEAQCACSLNMVALDSSVGILSRVQLEGAHSKADLVLGLDMNLLAQAKSTGLFAPHGIDSPGLELPVDWRDDSFLPFDYGYFAFIYDTQTLPKPPASLKELVEAPDDLKMVIQDPRTSTPGLGLMLWVRAVYGADAPAAWEKLAPKIVTVTKGWSEAYGLFLKGEAPLVLSYTTSPAYHMIVEEEERYQAANFAEGHYMQIEVAGMLKTAPEPELARQFLKFMLSPDFQNVIPTGNWMYPVTAGAADLPPAFEKLIDPAVPLLFEPEDIKANQKAWLDEWLAAMVK